MITSYSAMNISAMTAEDMAHGVSRGLFVELSAISLVVTWPVLPVRISYTPLLLLIDVGVL